MKQYRSSYSECMLLTSCLDAETGVKKWRFGLPTVLAFRLRQNDTANLNNNDNDDNDNDNDNDNGNTNTNNIITTAP